MQPPQTPPHRRALLIAFGCSGAASLAYEVIWTRALSVVLGSTTYALSSMLATFMLGLALGALLGGRLADRSKAPLAWLTACELGIGTLGIVSTLLIALLPSLYFVVYRALHLYPALFFFVQILLCSLVMLGPTLLMGMTFPLITRVLVEDVGQLGAGVGGAYGANTLGAVFGSLATGFFAIPTLGLRGAVFAAALVNLAVGLFFLYRSGLWRRYRVAAVVALYLLGGAALLASKLPGGELNFYNAHRHLGPESYDDIVAEQRNFFELLFDEVGRDGAVRALRGRDGQLLLQVGGKKEGTLTDDLPNTLLLAQLPAAAHPNARTALVVGLGAGVTLAAAKRVVDEVALVEINDTVVEAVRRVGPPGVLDGVHLFHDDARNLLLRSELRYDIITSEPSYPSDFSVANLFTREFFAIAATRLSDAGVYCQWLPYYLLTNDDVTMMLKTFASVFAYATLWKVPGSLDLLLLGSRVPFARTPQQIIAEVERHQPGLRFELSRGVEQMAAIARRPDVPMNTDDLPLLEFHVARNLRVGDLRLLEAP